MIVPMPAGGTAATLDGLDFSLKPPKWARKAVKTVAGVVAKVAPIAAIAAPFLAPVLAPAIAAGTGAIKATGIGGKILSVAAKAKSLAANPIVGAATQTIKHITQPAPSPGPVTVAEAAANIKRPSFGRNATTMPVRPGDRRKPLAFDAAQRGAAARKPTGPRGGKPVRGPIGRGVNQRPSIVSQFQRAREMSRGGAATPVTVQQQAASMVNPVSLAPTGEASPPVAVDVPARVTPQLHVSMPATSQAYADDFTPAPGLTPATTTEQPAGGLPGWVLPAALAVGIGVVVMGSRKRGAR